MPEPKKDTLRSFWVGLLILSIAAPLAGLIYANRLGVPLAAALPIIVAFLLQLSANLAALLPNVRSWLKERLPPGALASLLFFFCLIPYLVYSIPTGVFLWTSLLKLMLLASVPAFLFALFPARVPSLTWQDVLVMAFLAYPVISGLSPLLRDIYVSPHDGIRELHALGKLMIFSLGAMAFLLIRDLQGARFRLGMSRTEFGVGIRNYLLFLPLGLPLALGVGFVRFQPRMIDDWAYVFGLIGAAAGWYVGTALSEELYFRGVLQNLLIPRLGPATAQVLASVLFGLAHLSSRGFPNWRYALVAAAAGWFYGRAYVQAGSVVAAAVTHTMVVLTWRYLFI